MGSSYVASTYASFSFSGNVVVDIEKFDSDSARHDKRKSVTAAYSILRHVDHHGPNMGDYELPITRIMLDN